MLKKVKVIGSNPQGCVFLIDLLHSIYKVYRDKLQNCSCNQFHYVGTHKQVKTNSMTKNIGEGCVNVVGHK